MNATFYNVNVTNDDAKIFFVCELIESLYEQEKSMFVWCENKNQAERLDEALWQFKEDSFIPHNVEGEGPIPLPPVHLLYTTFPKSHCACLINLTSDLPKEPRHFKEMILFIDENEEKKQKLREHYRTLQSLGFKVTYQQAKLTTK